MKSVATCHNLNVVGGNTASCGVDMTDLGTARYTTDRRIAAACLMILLAFALPTRRAQAQAGRSSAGSSPTLEESNYPPQPEIFRPKWRQDGEKHGVILNLEEIYDFQGNLSGGRTQMGTVFGRATGVLNLDLEKLVRWHNAKITASGIFETGSNLAQTYIGSFVFTSSITGPHTLRFNEYYLQQSFLSQKVTLKAGQIAAATEFDNQAIGFDDQESAFKSWINLNLANNPQVASQANISFPPAGKPGFLVLAIPTPHLLFKAGVFQAPHSPFQGDPSGVRFDLRNAPLAALTLGWRQGGENTAHPGIYKIGLIHNFGTYQRFVTHDSIKGNDVPFVDVGQAIWRVKNGNGTYSHAGVDGQFSITIAPRAQNKEDAETLGGIRFVGLFSHRPADTQGVAVIHTRYSRDYSRDLMIMHEGDKTSETAMEVNYKFVIRRWVSVWPNFQYIWKPSGDRRLSDAPVLGLRIVFDH